MSPYFYYSLARIELFDGKGSLVEGSIERVDRTGLDFVAINDPIVIHPKKPQWDVFAAFGKSPCSVDVYNLHVFSNLDIVHYLFLKVR